MCIGVYAGQYFDEETELHYNLNRYYNPKTGRYLRADPFGDGLNLYSYVYNNPQGFIDPLGLCAAKKAWDSWGDFVTDPKVWALYQLLDIVVQGAGPVTWAFDIAAAVFTQIDILTVDVSITRKVVATGLNFLGLAGGFVGGIPNQYAVPIGIVVDVTVYVAINNILHPKSQTPDSSSPLSNKVSKPINSNKISRPMPPDYHNR